MSSDWAASKRRSDSLNCHRQFLAPIALQKTCKQAMTHVAFAVEGETPYRCPICNTLKDTFRAF